MEKKLISILIPTRDRKGYVRKLINNISNTFSNYINKVEVLIKLDLDDVDSHSLLQEKFDVEVKYVIYDRLEGYPSITKFITDLGRLSNAYYLWPINDDLLFVDLSNLIEVLESYKEVPTITNNEDDAHFPIINYKIFEILDREFEKEITYWDGYYNYLRSQLPTQNALRVEYKIQHPSNEVKHGYHNEMYVRRRLEMESLDFKDLRQGYHPYKQIERDIKKITEALNI